ncbi:winged helix-turn-helix domain-containing protein [Pseudarthrobacter sp. BIM B-2242]|uniref:winged helix-turn-helix domain-containing protein n=1 Tax=Pseudarthrobacter sp. BIM B-2242 TaxID=2772401 RepID=UPI00168B3C26|nr:winged helix-turn-helix domain-containing protein [Pseudarthrobacter sp. BIM B-2242]QOD03622.1 winged helix-turn-helix transcriptional regulator [Pseudarthrobacter sp. BIM B-2242]
MAVHVHHPGRRAGQSFPRECPPPAVRGLAVWIMCGSESDVDGAALARSARLVLDYALKFAPEAEVQWPAPGAATSAVEGAAADSSQLPSTAELPSAAGKGAAWAETADDRGTRLPPSAGPVSHVTVDLAANQVLLDGKPVHLTGVEYKVLRYLVTHLSCIVGREELQQFLDTFETPGAATRSIDTYVGRIRRKLGNARQAVATVRGKGYQFVPGAHATVRGPAEYCI